MEFEPFDRRESGVSKIIGVDAERERAILDYFKGRFEGEFCAKADKEHPPELDSLITRMNHDMREFLAAYDVAAIDVPPKNVHIIDRSKLTPKELEVLEREYGGLNGFYTGEVQHITMLIDFVEDNKLAFTQTLSHEELHLNSFLSFQKVKDVEEGLELIDETDEGGRETVKLMPRRLGFRIKAEDNTYYFYHLDEAVIEELVIRFDHQYFGKYSELAQEYQQREGFIREISHRGMDIEEVRRMVAHQKVSQLPDGNWKAVVSDYSNPDQRKELNKLIDELYIRNSSDFSSREEVFRLFVQGSLTGKLSPVARLIEKTLGEGSFRALGEKTRGSREADREANADKT